MDPSAPLSAAAPERPDDVRGYAAESPAATAAARRRGRARVVATSVLAFLAVGLAAVLALLVRDVVRRDALADARAEALGAARQEVVNFIALDYRTINTQAKRILADSTGSFAQQFRQQQAAVVRGLKANRVTSEATIRDAAVATATPTEAAVLVAVDNTVTSTQGRSQRRYRLRVHMVLVGGSWKIENVTFSEQGQ